MKGTPERRVMMSFTSPTVTSNPYVHLLVAALQEAGHDVEFLSWSRLLRGQTRLLHVHWPETMLARRTRVGRAVSRGLFLLMLLRVKFRLTAVVRTVHNRAPHEATSRIDAWLLRQLDAATTLWINLNSEIFAPNGRPARVIPHGELGSWYESHGYRTDAIPLTDLLYFGLVRPYKGVDQLAEILAAHPNLSLRIAGRPVDETLRSRLAAVTDRCDNIELDLRHIPDEELIAYIRASRLVVLPYTKFENSGSAMLALDLGAPVLVRASPSSLELQRLFGGKFVHIFSGELTADDITNALKAVVEGRPASRPVVAEREWGHQAVLHQSAYNAAMAAICGSAR